MFIGIDVGGTYTDAVLTDGKKIVAKKKLPTRHDNLLASLLGALDAVLGDHDVSAIQRVVLSTTLVTNVIAEGKYPPVALVLIPGPGISHSEYQFGVPTYIVSGAIDYRGREIAPLSPEEIVRAVRQIRDEGIERIAIVGKFSGRNNSHELMVKDLIHKNSPGFIVEMGHAVTGRLNFPRRVATTMLTAATRDVFASFVRSVSESLKERKISAPSFILKADGGTLPLTTALDMPVETIFSGPAASILGAMSLAPRGQTSVVVDIGGTTTDLALILSGEPLLASKGASAKGFLTHINSFAVSSVPLGGDSSVTVENGEIEILPERKGPAFCLGGPVPTVTDALRFLKRLDIGEEALAFEAVKMLADKTNKTMAVTAQEVADIACQTIVNSIKQMFAEWEQEPAYRIWEIMQKSSIKPNNIVGVGGAAGCLIPDVATNLNCKSLVPEHAGVANALGAAAAQPTITVNLRADTELGKYTITESGAAGNLPRGKAFSEEDALKLAKDALLDIADNLKIRDYVRNVEVIHSEVFNMVRGWSTTGKIYDISVQTPRDILFYLGQEESYE